MISPGNKIIRFFIDAAILWSLAASAMADNYYYICSYESNLDSANVLLTKINLDTKNSVWQRSIPIMGSIIFKNPLIIERNRGINIVAVTLNGLWGKNSYPLNIPATNYAIFDENGNQQGVGSLPGIGLIEKEIDRSYSDTSIKFFDNHNDNFLGYVELDSRNMIRIARTRPYVYRDTDFPLINRFKYFHKFNSRDNRLYWDIEGDYNYVLKINYNERRILDSLNLGYYGKYSSLLSLSDNDSILYSFALNWNCLNANEVCYKDNIDSSYLNIYSALSFALLDSISIPISSLNYGYSFRESGKCDVVGPFLVYYFLGQESVAVFSPAMLFIFDTRTNEATWLRVGWR